MATVWAGAVACPRPFHMKPPDGKEGIMIIEYRARDNVRHRDSGTNRAACLDCADCRGMCWAALQLRLLPDLILKDKGATA